MPSMRRKRPDGGASARVLLKEANRDAGIVWIHGRDPVPEWPQSPPTERPASQGGKSG